MRHPLDSIAKSCGNSRLAVVTARILGLSKALRPARFKIKIPALSPDIHRRKAKPRSIRFPRRAARAVLLLALNFAFPAIFYPASAASLSDIVLSGTVKAEFGSRLSLSGTGAVAPVTLNIGEEKTINVNVLPAGNWSNIKRLIETGFNRFTVNIPQTTFGPRNNFSVSSVISSPAPKNFLYAITFFADLNVTSAPKNFLTFSVDHEEGLQAQLTIKKLAEPEQITLKATLTPGVPFITPALENGHYRVAIDFVSKTRYFEIHLSEGPPPRIRPTAPLYPRF